MVSLSMSGELDISIFWP